MLLRTRWALSIEVQKKGLAVEDSGCRAATRAAKGLMEQRFRPTETGEKGLILSVPCTWCPFSVS